MKVFFDHNISPRLARALRELYGDAHQISILSERFSRTVDDTVWIGALSREGRWIIISGDRRITRNRAEYAAFRNSRLVGSRIQQRDCDFRTDGVVIRSGYSAYNLFDWNTRLGIR